MVQNKKLLILVAILTVSLVPRFLFTGVQTVLEERPVQSLPDNAGEWEAVDVFVCPQCQEELRQAVWQRTDPPNPDAKMSYTQSDLKDNSCPVHHLPVVRTKDVPVSFHVVRSLPPGTEFLQRWYRKGPADDPSPSYATVTVVISGSDKRSIHRPERCLQAQDWKMISRDKLSLPLPDSARRNFPVSRVVAWLPPRGERREVKGIVFYWYMGSNRLTASNLKRLAYTAWDRIAYGLNYRWAYALVISPVQDSVAQTTSVLGDLASKLLPLICEKGRLNP
jgi:EpsI family protein